MMRLVALLSYGSEQILFAARARRVIRVGSSLSELDTEENGQE